MPEMTLNEAIDTAVARAMAEDDRIVVFGEDVPMIRSGLATRFGADRVMPAPISEAAFVSAGAAAAMAGLRPVVELLMADFIAVAMDAVLNHIAKLETFAPGWPCPLVLRVPCGAGYGDGGQHGQTLWGMLGQIPGISVAVPSTPADGHGLMLAAIAHDGPVILLEHKLLAQDWLSFLGGGGRDTVTFDVPKVGARGAVDPESDPIPLGRAAIVRAGTDVTVVSLAVGVHRALAAADEAGLSCEVIDLRSVRPLDSDAVVESVRRTGRLLVVDEDYRDCGLSGELAACVLEAGLTPKFGRVCLEDTIPYARPLEEAALPNVGRIVAALGALSD